MATLYIREFETIPLIGSQPAQIWAEPGTADQTVTLSGSSQTKTLSATTRYVMMSADGIYSYTVTGPSGTPTATTSMMRVPADNIISFAVPTGGAKIAVITNT